MFFVKMLNLGSGSKWINNRSMQANHKTGFSRIITRPTARNARECSIFKIGTKQIKWHSQETDADSLWCKKCTELPIYLKAHPS